VAGKIPERTIDEIRDRTDILSLIGKYVPLKKAGRNFVGLCPFHAEKTPSFSVNPEKGIFKCFGCGKGGNAITFLMDVEGMSFTEAVKQLGDQCGVRVQSAPESKNGNTDRTTALYTINEDARSFFAENLKTPQAKEAVEYLKKRGLDGETVRLFQIGYAAAGWDGLISYLRRMGRSEKLLALAGLAIEGERGMYDRFRDRIIFPIRDHRERCVGFGGRIVSTGEPKYMNSPETPIYHKGEVLYGLDITREEIRKAGWAVVVEGYLDLIALFQAGIRNVVASLGTALTKDHLSRLGRYTKDVVLLFDPDEAGIRAAERTLPLFGDTPMYARAAIIPNGDDPDDFVRKNGPAAFHEIISTAADIFDFALDRVFARHDLSTARGVSSALAEAAGVIEIKKTGVDRDFYITRVTERLGILERTVRDAVSREAKKEAPRRRKEPDAESPSQPFHPPVVEARLFKIAANFPHVLSQAGLNERHLELFEDEILKKLITTIIKTIGSGDTPPLATLIESVTDEGIRNELIGLSFVDFDEIEDETGALDIARGCVSHLEEKEHKNRLKEMTRRIKEGASKEAVNELLKEKMDYTKNLKR
jgi:DNA primase